MLRETLDGKKKTAGKELREQTTRTEMTHKKEQKQKKTGKNIHTHTHTHAYTHMYITTCEHRTQMFP